MTLGPPESRPPRVPGLCASAGPAPPLRPQPGGQDRGHGAVRRARHVSVRLPPPEGWAASRTPSSAAAAVRAAPAGAFAARTGCAGPGPWLLPAGGRRPMPALGVNFRSSSFVGAADGRGWEAPRSPAGLQLP